MLRLALSENAKAVAAIQHSPQEMWRDQTLNRYRFVGAV